MKKLLLLLALLASSFTSVAQMTTLMTSNFDDQNWSPDFVHPSISASTITQVGVNVTGFGNGVNAGANPLDRAPFSNQWPTIAPTPDLGKYYEFTLTANPGKTVELGEFRAYIRHSGNGPGGFELRSSEDSYGAYVYRTVMPTSSVWYERDTSLSSLPILENGGSITFRMYAFAGTNTIGTFGVDSLRITGREVFRVQSRVILSGAWNGSEMKDDLRFQGLLPLTDPYGLGVVTASEALATEGSDAIVDWIILELRNSIDPSIVTQRKACLLQADGDIVSEDGSSLPLFSQTPGDYFVAVKHRNHLGVMTGGPLSFPGSEVDFTNTLTSVWGVQSMKQQDGFSILWQGDVSGNGVIQYTGEGNDRDLILEEVGGVVPTSTSTGYLPSDTNLDGEVRYTGEGNDRDPILESLGGVVPTNVRIAQVP